MTAQLAATPRDMLGRPSVRTNHVLRLFLPDGTLNIARRSVCSDTLGWCAPSVLSWGAFAIDSSGLDGSLQGVEFTVRVQDYDGSLTARRNSGERFEGSRATLLVLSPAWDFGDSPVPFDGEIDRVEVAGSLEFDFVLRVPDRPLRRDLALTIFTEADWPRINRQAKAIDTPPEKALGQPAPTYWGLWDSASAGSGGSVQCWNVDTRKHGFNGWVVMARAGTVLRAFDAGTLLDSSDWSQAIVTRNSRVFLEIFADTAYAGGASAGRFDGPVTVDLSGVEDVGDGTGDLLSNPADIIEDALNMLWGGTAPLNAAALALTRQFFEDLGLRGSFHVREKETGVDLLNRWLATWPFLRAAWTFATGTAEIAIYPLDWRSWEYSDATWLRYFHRDDGSKVELAYDTDRLLDRVRVQYLQNTNAGYLRAIEARDPDSAFGAASEDLPADGLTNSLG